MCQLIFLQNSLHSVNYQYAAWHIFVVLLLYLHLEMLVTTGDDDYNNEDVDDDYNNDDVDDVEDGDHYFDDDN